MATDMYFKLEGLKGETLRDGHEGDIEILSWSFGGSNQPSLSNESGLSGGKVDLQEISFTKWVDATSPLLFQEMCKGKHFTSGTLAIYKAGGEQSLKYLELKFTGMMITSLAIGGSGGEDRLTENISMAFEQIVSTYTVQQADGTAKGTVVGGFNIMTNKPA